MNASGNAIVAQTLITLGGLFLLGLLADLASRHSALPRVTLLLLAGVAVGPAGLNWLPDVTGQLFPILTGIALAVIAFLLGGRLTIGSLRKVGALVLGISLGVVVATFVVIAAALMLAGVDPPVALVLGAVATSTAPAATADVVHQLNAKGPFAEVLLQIVAIDDAWGLLVFTLALAAAHAALGHGTAIEQILIGLKEIGLAGLLGIGLGIPFAFLTGRIRPGEPTLAEALGIVLLVAGLAELIGVSYILTSMVLGAVVANLARHHDYPFHAIEGIEWPFLLLFFLLAGAALDVQALASVGWLAGAYMLLRVAGRFLGAGIGGYFGGMPARSRLLMAMALLPQAGIAIGMALMAAQELPQLSDIIVPVVLSATVVFEILGPVATRWALTRSAPKT